MIHTDTRGSLDERNPAFFGRFPQCFSVYLLAVAWWAFRSILHASGFSTTVLHLCYFCATNLTLLFLILLCYNIAYFPAVFF